MMQVAVTIRPSGIHGQGCFAAEPIAKGTMVWRYAQGVDPETPRDLCDYPDEARFINHAADPNTVATPNGDTVAIRDIEAGEEITEDYWQTVPDLARRRLHLQEFLLAERADFIAAIAEWKQAAGQAIAAHSEECLRSARLAEALERAINLVERGHRCIERQEWETGETVQEYYFATGKQAIASLRAALAKARGETR